MPFLIPAITAVAGFFGIGVSAAVAAQIATSIALTAISVGASLVARMLKGRPRLDALDGPTHTITSEVVNARFLAGKMRTPGVLCYFGAAGREARMGLVLGEGPCEGLADDGTPERTGKAVIWIDGKRVQLERTTQSGGDLLKPVSGDKYDGKIEIREYFAADGAQGAAMRTAATTELIDNENFDAINTPDDEGWDNYHNPRQIKRLVPSPFPPWTDGADGTDAHKLQGLSWVYVKLTQPNYKDAEGRPNYDKRTFTRVPNIEFLIKGMKLRWPGLVTQWASGTDYEAGDFVSNDETEWRCIVAHTSSATGEPTQTNSGGTNWEEDTDPRVWTENAAAVRYWWETERRGRSADLIDEAAFTAAYATCEEEVDVADDLPTGYEEFRRFGVVKKYAINGVITAGDEVSSVEDQLDAAWAGEVIEAGGKLLFKPGAERPATAKLDLSGADIVAPPSVQPWAPLQDRVNAIDIELAQSRAHGWSKLSLPEYVDSDALDRDGVKRAGSLRLAYVTDPLAAGRLQAVNLRRARESLRLEASVTPGDNFERLPLIPTDVVTVTVPEHGLTDARMEVERVSIEPDWSVVLSLREVLDDTYDDTLVLPELISREIYLPDETDVPAMTNLSADEIAVIDKDGKTVIHLEASWTPAPAPETEIAVREKVAAGETENEWNSGTSTGANYRFSPVVVAKTYEIRARHANREGVVSDWSSTIERTVGGDLTAPGAVTDLNVLSGPNSIRATWTNPSDDDFAVACVYVGTTDTFADATLAATLAADVYEASGWTAGTEYRVWVRAKDRSGNEGAATGPELVTPTAFAEEGVEILTGDDAPDDTNDGKDGDLYVRADGTLWIKAGGTWTNTDIDLTGDPGAQIHTYDDTDSSGDPAAPPDTIDANINDIAIHTESGQWYQLTATGWQEEGDLTGQQGEQGLQGTQGIQGLTGDAGEKGNKGPQGNTGAQGLAGDAGDKGNIGPQGNTGTQGVAGSPGADGDQVFVYYTNAPDDTDPDTLAPVARLANGNWVTNSEYYWYADATQIPDDTEPPFGLNSLAAATGEVARMLIVAGAPPELYHEDTAGEILDPRSDTEVTTNLDISRIQWTTAKKLVLHRTGTAAMSSYWGTGLEGASKSIFLYDGTTGVEIAYSTFESADAATATFAPASGSAAETFLDGLAEDDLFLIVIADDGAITF